MARRYRPHRGSLAESVAATVEVTNRDQLIDVLKSDLPIGIDLDWSKLVIEPHFMQLDERIGWDQTWLVCIPGIWVFGYTDGPGD